MSVAPAAAPVFRRRLPPPRIGNTLYELLAKLPKNGVGARVAPITWAVNNKPNSFYTITEAKLHWVPKLTRKGYPLVLVDGKVVPADEKYSAVQYEKSRLERDELERATRAGEELDADEDGDGPARPLTDDEKHEQDRKAGLLKPKGQAWGWGLWEGEALPAFGTPDAPALITEDALKHKWREVNDETEVKMYKLLKLMPVQHKRSVHKIV